MYSSGARKAARNTWTKVEKISLEEKTLAPLLSGWVPQYRVLTGVHTYRLPRLFLLDFAMPDRKVYVEIDGKVHRLRAERDARRDMMLAERGWVGLRIPAADVREDPHAVISRITKWLIVTGSRTTLRNT